MVVTKCDILKSRGTYPSALESDLVGRTHLLEFSFVWKYKQCQTITTRYILMHKNANQGTAKVSLINNSSMVYVHVYIYIHTYFIYIIYYMSAFTFFFVRGKNSYTKESTYPTYDTKWSTYMEAHPRMQPY